MNTLESIHVRKIINSLKQRQYKTFYITLQNAYEQQYSFSTVNSSRFSIYEFIRNSIKERSYYDQIIIKQRRYYFYKALERYFIPGQEKEKCKELLDLFISLLREKYCIDDLSKSYWRN